ncbi:MAG: phospholipase D-like domain-containing protein [Thermoplasmatota archaeon]
MQKRMVGKAMAVVIILFISIAGFNSGETLGQDIPSQKTGSFPFTTINSTANITSYCAPDNSYQAFNNLLKSVDDSLYISVYEFQNIHIARSISNLSENGVEVQLMIESDPVGGISSQEMYCLDIMKSSGVNIKGTDPGKFNYSYLHSKYIIADNESVLVSSENFGYTGYPIENSNGNRGWGVIIEDENTAEYYNDIFLYDWNNSKTINIYSRKSSKTIEKGGYYPEFDPKTIETDITIKPIIGPEYSLLNDSILKMIKEAEKEIFVQQFYIGDWEENPYVDALIDSAERGIEVKILLDSTWYNIQEEEKDNDDFVEYIDNHSEKKDLNIKCRLINEYHGFSKTHNKGMVVDGEKVLISSINWNLHSIKNNREVGVIIENKEVSEYFKNIFLHDWDDDLIKPIPEAGQDRTVETGQKIIFNGNKSWDDNDIKKYLWDLDGDGDFEREGKMVNHIFKKEGRYEIRLKVVDQEGHESMDEAEIKVENKNNSSSRLYLILLSISLFILISILLGKRFKG